MIRDVEEPVRWMGQEFCGIDHIGFNERGVFVVALHTTSPGTPRGSYFTTIPISPQAYRVSPDTFYGERARAAVRDCGDHIIIYDDWRMRHDLAAPRGVLEQLLAECDEQRIPRENVESGPNPPAPGQAPGIGQAQ